MNLKTRLRTTLAVIILSCFLNLVQAQGGPGGLGGPGGPGDPGIDPGGGNTTNTPIDGGLSLLVAAGIGYGLKNIHDKRKKKETERLSKKRAL